MTDSRVFGILSQGTALQAQAHSLMSLYGHRSVAEYQEWFRLPVTGEMCAHTVASLVQPRCGCPDVRNGDPSLPAVEGRWPQGCIDPLPTAYRFSGLRGISSSVQKRAWLESLKKWNDACGLNLTLISDFSKARIAATSGALPGSTLAWSYLANGNCNATLAQKYDTTVTWSFDFFAKTVLHEIGHAIGLGHSRDPNSIMFPSIHPTKPFSDYLGREDVRLVVGTYGENSDPVDPEPPATPPSDKNCKASVGQLIMPSGTYDIVPANDGVI